MTLALTFWLIFKALLLITGTLTFLVTGGLCVAGSVMGGADDTVHGSVPLLDLAALASFALAIACLIGLGWLIFA